MKRSTKTNILCLLIVGSISSSSFGMWQAAKTRFAACKPAFANFIRANATLNAFKAKPQLFAQRIKSVDTNKLKLSAVIAGNTIAAGFGFISQYNNPKFTAENIVTHDETFMEHFIQQVPANIKKNNHNTRTISTLLYKYPQASQKIIDAVLQQSIDETPVSIFKTLIDHCPEFRPQFIKSLFETDNKLCHTIFATSSSYLSHREEYIEIDGENIIDYVVNYITKHPRHISITAFNTLTKYLDDALSQVYFGTTCPLGQYINHHRIKLRSAAIGEYGNITSQELLELLLNPQAILNKPKCMLQLTKKGYLQLLADDVIKHSSEVKKTASEHHAHLNLKAIINQITEDIIEDQAIINLDSFGPVLQKIKAKPIVFTCSPIQQLFHRAHSKQKEEQAKGNHLFFHGRNPEWEFISDTYKQAYNIANPDKKVGDDYTFLRFNDSKTQLTYATDGIDALWMNAALYGNANHKGSCTASYVLNGRDCSGGPNSHGITAQSIFTQLGLNNYYASYSEQLATLQQLHTTANPNKIGNLLAISVPENELNRIKIPQIYNSLSSTLWNWLTWKKSTPVQDAIKSKQIKDNYEFVLPLTSDYALDPHKGPRIYSFNGADPEKYKEYEQYRDQLFAKITKHTQADKTA